MRLVLLFLAFVTWGVGIVAARSLSSGLVDVTWAAVALTVGVVALVGAVVVESG